ncbi:hypothetical protein GVAV_003088 [Gurleya vavrai]
MNNLEEIIKNAYLDQKIMKQYPDINVCHIPISLHDKLNALNKSSLDFKNFNDILNFFQFSNYEMNFSIEENIKFLKKIKNLFEANNLNLDIQDLEQNYLKHKKMKDDEDHLDLMEIRLVKMKNKLMHKENINLIKDKPELKDLFKSLKDRTLHLDHKNYIHFLSFLQDNEDFKNVISNFERINNSKDCIEKNVILFLIKNGKTHLGTLADFLGCERLELLQCVISMTYAGIAIFDRINDTVKIN